MFQKSYTAQSDLNDNKHFLFTYRLYQGHETNFLCGVPLVWIQFSFSLTPIYSYLREKKWIYAFPKGICMNVKYKQYQLYHWFEVRVFLLLDWLPYYLLIFKGEEMNLCISKGHLHECKMQTVSTKIWTWVTVSDSRHDNH